MCASPGLMDVFSALLLALEGEISMERNLTVLHSVLHSVVNSFIGFPSTYLFSYSLEWE